MEGKRTKNAYIVTHTHWDREWRYPIWENRLYLIDLVDELLETLDNDDEYDSFLFDGQVISILDYIEMRPENTEKIKKYISEGKIHIGPWYTLPDLYPVSGESLIRNLYRGIRESEKLGRCMKIGYESFGWGQTAQFPQIYKGFDIDTVIVAKHVDKSRAVNCEFLWAAPDGSTVLATRLGNDARANFFMNSYIEIMNGMEYNSKSYRYSPKLNGMAYHRADEDGFIQDHFLIENTSEVHEENISGIIMKSWNNISDSLLKDNRILMNGSDSTTCQPSITKIVESGNKALDENGLDVRIKLSSLEEYVDILKTIDNNKLVTIPGELRDGPATSLSANALMTRPYIKMLNRKVQNMLFACAEPFGVVNHLAGERYDHNFLDKSLEYLLLSHPHDSINGVTQDKTVDDVMYRLNQSLELADVSYNRDCVRIIKNINYENFSSEDIVLVAFNTLPIARNEIVKAYVDIPREYDIWDFVIVDDEGIKFEPQIIDRKENVSPVSDLYSRPWPFYTDRYSFYFETGEIPAGGYKTFKLEKTRAFNRDAKFWAHTRMTNGNEISKTSNCMENEFLQVHINNNGSVSILDKATGIKYDNLNYFEDDGDCGDYWIYYPPYHNRKYTSKGLQADIWVEDNGELSCTIGCNILMNLPVNALRHENGVKGESRRSENLRETEIKVYYTLKKGSEQLDVKLNVKNNCEDHRMKLMFDTGIDFKTAHAQGHFNVDERPLTPLKNSEGKYYNELLTQPMQNFIDVTDGKSGMGIVSDSFLEYEAMDNNQKTLSVTLFRAVRNIICTEMRSEGNFPDQKGGQCLRELKYNYAICPHKGNWSDGKLYDKASKLNVKVKLIQTSKPKVNGSLPLKYSFYNFPENLQVSAIRKSQDDESVVIRVYNPGDEMIEGEIKFFRDIKDVKIVNMNEDFVADAKFDGKNIVAVVEPYKIVTYKMYFKNSER